MKAGEPKLVLTIDGLDSTTTQGPVRATLYKDPTGCFFIILGLVYDALSTATSDSTATPEARATALTSIQVMAYLIRPEYAGQIILDPSILVEVVALWY